MSPCTGGQDSSLICTLVSPFLTSYSEANTFLFPSEITNWTPNNDEERNINTEIKTLRI